MRPTLLVSLCAAILLLWGALPLGSSGAGNQEKLSDIEHKIEVTQGKIGRRKGTEHVLSSDIARWTGRIRRLQGASARSSSVRTSSSPRSTRPRASSSAHRPTLRFQRARQVRLRTRLREARRISRARLVERYQADEPDLVTVILSSKGFAELLERGEFLKRINEQDQRIIALVRDAKADARENAIRLDKLERQAGRRRRAHRRSAATRSRRSSRA